MHYAISKYDSAYRIDGIYTRDEWTDYSEIGKKCGDHRLTKEEYLAVENRYLSTVANLLDLLGVQQMKVRNPEVYGFWGRLRGSLKLFPSTRDQKGILAFLRGCLRNQYWGELVHPAITLYTGYDFYLHLICDLPAEVLSGIVSQNNLFCQAFSDDDFAQAKEIDEITTEMCLASGEDTYPGGEDAIIERLAKLADLNQKDHGCPILHYAVEYQLESVIRYLLQNGADVNAREVIGGRTVLHTAVQVGNLQLVQLLLSHGADVNASDQDGNTPLMLSDREELAELLVKNGAKVRPAE